MRKMQERIELDNIIRISKNKKISEYFASVIYRGGPGVYGKYGDIRLRFTRDLSKDVRHLCMCFWHWGLVPKEINVIDLKVDGGVITGAYELVLKKVGAIQFENDTDFEDYWNQNIEEQKKRLKEK